MTSSPQFGIEAMSYYLPPDSQTIVEWGRATLQPPELIGHLAASGAERFHIAGEAVSVETMGCLAAEQLFRRHSIDPTAIDLIIYTHTMAFSVSPPPRATADIIRKHCGCTTAISMSISQQKCSSLFGVILLVKSLMETEKQLCNVLVITADKIINEFTRNVQDGLIQSDGASALVLKRNAERNIITGINQLSDPLYAAAIDRPANSKAPIVNKYVYYHSRTTRKAIQNTGMRLDELDLIIPPNEWIQSLRHVLKLENLPLNKLFTDNIARVGHVFCSDFIINFHDALEKSRFQSGNCLAFTNGDNGVFSAMTIAKMERTSCRKSGD